MFHETKTQIVRSFSDFFRVQKMENHQTDPYLDQLPPAINDDIAKMAMLETERLTKNVKNNNADDDDWDLKVDK